MYERAQGKGYSKVQASQMKKSQWNADWKKLKNVSLQNMRSPDEGISNIFQAPPEWMASI